MEARTRGKSFTLIPGPSSRTSASDVDHVTDVERIRVLDMKPSQYVVPMGFPFIYGGLGLLSTAQFELQS